MIDNQAQAPKYILTLGVPVTWRWRDEITNEPKKITYPVGTECGVIFAFVRRKPRNQRWVDCIMPDGRVLTIGHNRDHRLQRLEKEVEETIDKAAD